MIRFEELRVEHNLYQAKIAEILGVKRNTYSKWENCINDMNLDVCNQLVNFYQISFDYLLGLSNQKTIQHSKFTINYNLLSQRLKKERKNLGLSQKILGDKLGFPQTTYSQYENGTRKPTTLKLLLFAQFYHVSYDYLVGRTDKKEIL